MLSSFGISWIGVRSVVLARTAGIPSAHRLSLLGMSDVGCLSLGVACFPLVSEGGNLYTVAAHDLKMYLEDPVGDEVCSSTHCSGFRISDLTMGTVRYMCPSVALLAGRCC